MFSTEKQVFLGGNYIINLADEKLSYKVNDELYLYNCGTIAAKPVIKFTITPIFYNNKIVFPNKDNSKDANFTIGKNSLKFTTPNIITAYNQAVKIITNYGLEGSSVIELRNQLRDNLHNYYTRSYMLALLNSFIEGKSLVVNGKIQKGFDNAFLGEMKTFLKDDDSKTKPLTCIFDSQNGETLIEIFCKVFGKDEPLYIVENAGDMLKSKYLKIEGRTLPTEGFITNEKCLKVSSDCDLEDVSIDFIPIRVMKQW